jgi:ferredoxin
MTEQETNVPGKYTVDERYCLCTGNCVTVAPDNFKLVSGHAIVFKQPETPDEAARCDQAWQDCPVRAIDDDGGA